MRREVCEWNGSRSVGYTSLTHSPSLSLATLTNRIESSHQLTAMDRCSRQKGKIVWWAMIKSTSIFIAWLIWNSKQQRTNELFLCHFFPLNLSLFFEDVFGKQTKLDVTSETNDSLGVSEWISLRSPFFYSLESLLKFASHFRRFHFAFTDGRFFDRLLMA